MCVCTFSMIGQVKPKFEHRHTQFVYFCKPKQVPLCLVCKCAWFVSLVSSLIQKYTLGLRCRDK